MIDLQLDEIEHYQRFPIMKPFVGENYFNAKKKILVIAESHYLEGASSINTGPTLWYNSTQQGLYPGELNCVNTRQVVNTSKHMIFRELEAILVKSIDKFNGRAINSIAFMNGFQRPCQVPGQTIKAIASKKDFDVAINTITKVVEILEPEVVIFISKYTWEKVGKYLQKKEGIKYEFVCHPASGGKYWNNSSYPHSKNKMIELLEK